METDKFNKYFKKTLQDEFVKQMDESFKKNPLSYTSTTTEIKTETDAKEVLRIIRSFSARQENLKNEMKMVLEELEKNYEIVGTPYVENGKAYIFKCNDNPFLMGDGKEKLVIHSNFYQEIMRIKHELNNDGGR